MDATFLPAPVSLSVVLPFWHLELHFRCFVVKSGRKQQIFIQKKTLEVLSLLRPIVQWNIKNSQNHLVSFFVVCLMNSIYSSSSPLRLRCNRSHTLHPWPNGALEETTWLFFCCFRCVIEQWALTVIKLQRFSV